MQMLESSVSLEYAQDAYAQDLAVKRGKKSTRTLNFSANPDLRFQVLSKQSLHYGVTSKTTPSPDAPPPGVMPYRFPLASTTRLPRPGSMPSAPLGEKRWSIFSV